MNVKRRGGFNTEDYRGAGGRDEVGLAENSDLAKQALKDLCVSFQQAGRDVAKEPSGLNSETMHMYEILGS